MKISKKTIKKIISEELENVRDEMLLNEFIDPFGIADEDPAADRERAEEEAERAAREADRIKNPQNVYGNIPYARRTGPRTPPRRSRPTPAGQVRVKKGQGYWHLAKALGFNPRDRKIRGALRQAVTEKDGRSTLFTGRDYSWLKSMFTSTGEPRPTAGTYGDPETMVRSGAYAGSTSADMAAMRKASQGLEPGASSAEDVKKAALGTAGPQAGGVGITVDSQFYTPQEIERLSIVMNDPTYGTKVAAGEGNLTKQLAADEKAAKTRKKDMIDHAKERVNALKDTYGGVSISSGALTMLAKQAGVTSGGVPNWRDLERLIHDNMKRKQMRKAGQQGPIRGES